MSNLLASLTSAARSMKSFESALAVVQNNVINASTPGYARQQVDLVALAFQPESNLPGGVEARSLISTRSDYSEQTVRRRTERYGRYEQIADGLSQVEPIFDLSEGSGIAGSINNILAAFSQLAVTPNDAAARQNVIGRAEDVARNFNFTAESLARAGDQVDKEIRSVIASINDMAGRISDLNVELGGDYRNQSDAGVNARLYSTLEELAELVDFTALHQPDGTVTVLLGGQVPLVISEKTFPISPDLSGGQVAILDHAGNPVTAKLTEGRIGGLIESSSVLIPSYVTDLNRLAESFANKVNGVLAAGLDRYGQPPAVDLFQYDAALGAAATLGVTNITSDDIAAATAGAPGGNGNALDLTELANSKEIDGLTFTEFYGSLGGRVGRDLRAAQEDAHTQSLLLSQARSLRDEVSGVNLDEEAASLIEFQRSYQAAAQMIRVLNEMTLEVFRILP